MPEAEQGRTESRPFVSLAANSGASVEPSESEAGYDTEASEFDTEAEGPGGQTETAEGEEGPEPPTAEELGLSEDSPEYKEAYKKLLANWTRWKNRDQQKRSKQTARTESKAAKKDEAEADSAETEAPQPRGAEGGDPFDSLYRVDLDSFRPEVKLAENSELGEYREEIMDIAAQVARAMINHTLGSVRSNDIAFRRQMETQSQQAKAASVIGGFIESIEEHPEYAEKEEAIRAFAVKTRDLALSEPEEWVDLVERKFGLGRDWRGDADAGHRQRVDESRRTTQKLRSVMPRVSRGAAPSGGSPRGDMKFEDALEGALRGFRPR